MRSAVRSRTNNGFESRADALEPEDERYISLEGDDYDSSTFASSSSATTTQTNPLNPNADVVLADPSLPLSHAVPRPLMPRGRGAGSAPLAATTPPPPMLRPDGLLERAVNAGVSLDALMSEKITDDYDGGDVLSDHTYTGAADRRGMDFAAAAAAVGSGTIKLGDGIDESMLQSIDPSEFDADDDDVDVEGFGGVAEDAQSQAAPSLNSEGLPCSRDDNDDIVLKDLGAVDASGLPFATSFQQPEDARLAVVAILGTPNAGKSVFVNRLSGNKVSAVSPKRNTTRLTTLGVVTKDNCQVGSITLASVNYYLPCICYQMLTLIVSFLTLPGRFARHAGHRTARHDARPQSRHGDVCVASFARRRRRRRSHRRRAHLARSAVLAPRRGEAPGARTQRCGGDVIGRHAADAEARHHCV
jgi:hypothetical protein